MKIKYEILAKHTRYLFSREEAFCCASNENMIAIKEEENFTACSLFLGAVNWESRLI